MFPRHKSSFRHASVSIVLVIGVASALSAVFVLQDAAGQGNANAKAAVKAPPRPIGSANVIVKPGMSQEDWEKAYKETGRPLFNRNKVKRAGGNVERD